VISRAMCVSNLRSLRSYFSQSNVGRAEAVVYERRMGEGEQLLGSLLPAKRLTSDYRLRMSVGSGNTK
jgi:hypothetical protein